MPVIPARDLPPGTRLGKFEVKEMIGRGGMGAVYRAWDGQLQRDVAIKTLAPVDDGASQSAMLRARFAREALAIGSVRHQNVVQIYEAGFADDGTPFIVMEYLEGKTLSEVMKSRPDAMAVADTVEIMLGVCAGVAAIHRRGIIHRDLKPANVMVTKTDFQDAFDVKVLDFGVSKASTENDLTHDGQIVGTPNYMSPEQARGKVDAVIDARADQYALGVLLYACLTRRLPYPNLTYRDLSQALNKGDFTKPREIRAELPPELEAVILRAMSLDPAERFPTVQHMGRALLRFATERAEQKWTWMFASVPHPVDPAISKAMGIPEPTPVTPILNPPEPSISEGGDPHNRITKFANKSSPVPTAAPSPPSEPVLAIMDAVPQAEMTAAPSRSVVTSTKQLPAAAAWSVDNEPPSPASVVGHVGESLAAVEAAPPAPPPPQRRRRIWPRLAAGAIALVGVAVGAKVLWPSTEVPLGVRNLPAGSPILAAPHPAAVPARPPLEVVPVPAPAAPPVPDQRAPDGAGAAATGSPAAVPGASASAARPEDGTSRSHERRKRRDKNGETKRRGSPKVELGTNGVPILE